MTHNSSATTEIISQKRTWPNAMLRKTTPIFPQHIDRHFRKCYHTDVVKSRRSSPFNILMAFDRKVGSDCDRLAGALRYARSKTNWNVRCLCLPSDTIRNDIRYFLSDWKPDGIILGKPLPSFLSSSFLPRRPVIASIDCICSQKHKPDIRVTIDNALIGTHAAEILFRRKIIHFAYFSSFPFKAQYEKSQLSHSNQRKRSFHAAVAKISGSTFDSLHMNQGSETWTKDVKLLSTWLKALPYPCGIMAYNDESAEILLQICRVAHINIPEQISIVGVDNDQYICETSVPTLSSIEPNFEQAGYVAAKTLDERLVSRSKRPSCDISYGIKNFCERQSTLDRHGSGRLVSAANDIIRAKACSGIGVSAMANTLNVSTRLLELRFQEVYGYTIRDELKRVRLENIAKLLTTTQKNISDICYESGFQTLANAQTLFKRKYGKSMTDFRHA